MNYSNIKKLLSCSFYLKHPFVRFKLVLIAWIKNKMNISNKLFINLSLMLLCPIYELRFRLVYIKWYRYQYKSCRTLIDKMCNEKIINPFYLYIYVFVIILMLYSLHWSILLPDLSIELIVFLLITFILSLIYGLHIQKCRKSFFQIHLMFR